MIIFLNLFLLKSHIRVQRDSLFDLSFDNYEKNFLFIVNREKIHTSRIIADILSPKINNLHITDPRVNTFTINTINSGNFSFFLQLINFNFNEIPDEEIPFINEVASILETKFIEIEEEERELTLDKAINRLMRYEKYKNVYSKQIEEEINFIATNFYMINNSQKSSICCLKKFIIDQLFNHSNLHLKDEDQLLKIVNQFYINNSNYSYMYEYVDFNEVSNKCLTSFLKIYNYSDLTQKVWKLISDRLEKTDNKNTSKRHQYIGKSFLYQDNESFNGIIDYLIKKSKNINEEIIVTASSYNSEANHSIFNYEDKNSSFLTQSKDNSWISLEFKNHLIKPFNYTIRINNYDNVDNLKSWNIEGSNNSKEWFLVDERKNVPRFFHNTFAINPIPERMKYFRIRMTDKSWQNRGYLEINSLEIYGELFKDN